MKMSWWCRAWFLITCFVGFSALAHAQPTPGMPAAETAPVLLDVVTLKDGSVIYGEVVEMSGGVLLLKTPSTPDAFVKLKWADVTKLSVNHPLPFHLKEGTILKGTATAEHDGTLNIQVEPLKGSMPVPMDSIASVNPLIQPPVVYTGNLQGGYSQSTGNSQQRSASLIGEFVGKSELLRMTILGRYVYGDNAGEIQARNARGTIKLDFFVTKKFYWFTSAYFEKDTKQDLTLRTALATGPGYQFIDKGDFEGPWREDMSLYAELGIAYYNSDFKNEADETSTRARWSLKFDWPMFDDEVTLYHFDEFFPSLQNINDYYLTSDTGARFKLIGGFVSGIQWTLRYNSRPAPGTKDTDNLYLLTLGYSFDTSRKRK